MTISRSRVPSPLLDPAFPGLARCARTILLGACLAANGTPTHAGGFILTFVATEEPSPIPGEVIVVEQPVRWDTRCLPTHFVVNDSLDPLPNPLGEDFLSLAETIVSLQESMDPWNEIPTSYIELAVSGTRSSPELPVDDQISEISFLEFPGGGFLGAASVITLDRDSTLAPGDDIDGDGDSDVAAGLATCADVDGDGDIELAPGFYPSTTVIESDVFFSPQIVRYTVRLEDIDSNPGSFDLPAVAVHEFGHSLGLAHSPTGQVSSTDGASATMFPFLSGFSILEQVGQRSPAPEEIGLASALYPEGTATSGPAALQPGDLAFDDAFGWIEGEVTHGVVGVPLAGANVLARDRATGEVVASLYAGGLRVSSDPATGRLRFLGLAESLLGDFRLPVPPGEYEVIVEPVDGTPIPTSSAISLGARISGALGLMDFPEEAFHEGQEGSSELFPGRGTPVPVQAGHSRTGVDLVTNRQRELATFDLPPSQFGFATGAPGAYLAQEVPVELLIAADTAALLAVHSANFLTLPLDSGRVPKIGEAMLTTGRRTGPNTAEIDVAEPLARVTDFVAQDFDLTPVFFQNPVALGERVREAIAAGAESFFLVLRTPNDGSVPDFNLFVRALRPEEGEPDGAFFSIDGVTFFDSPIPVPLYFTLSLSDGD